MMYKSVMEIIQGNLQAQLEGEIMRVVHSVDVNVDKDELIKALAYDRQQYEKGYADAKEKYQRPHGEWISVEDRLPDKMGFYLVASRYGVVSCKWFNWIGGIPIFEYELVEEGYYTHWMPLPEPPISGAKMEGDNV